MITDPLSAIAVIVGAAVLCQLVAARANVPSVLFLLVAGVAMSSVIDPDAIFGELLFTGVGLGVAILLFEGGTGLHWSNLRTGKVPVLRLVTIGALVAWAIGTVAANLFLDIDTEIAVLIGAILVVSGPTVVIPLLRVVRPRQPTSSILRWEGILIDPIGAGVAIVVLDAIVEERALSRSLLRVVTTFGAGLAVGGLVSVVLVVGLRRRLIADHLQVPATLAMLVVAYAGANALRPEAGLVAATLLGMAFANQRRAPAAHIAEFNEHLGATVLGVLFIVLGARVDIAEIIDTLGPSLLIIAVLVLVARPATVLVSTVGTSLSWRDRGFIMVLAPRGVVAAAVASLFALELEHNEIDPGPLVPVVFTVVVGTVTLTGLAARFAARQLRVAQPKPNGLVMIGGGRFSIELAEVLAHHRVPTLHVGLDDDDANRAAQLGQLAYQGRLDSEDFPETVRAVGIAAAVALSGTDHLDAYASERIARVIGSANIYGPTNQAVDPEPGTTRTVARQTLLPPELVDEDLEGLMDRGYRLKAVPGYAPIPGWFTLGRVNEEGFLVFDKDPSRASETDHLIQFGQATHSHDLP